MSDAKIFRANGSTVEFAEDGTVVVNGAGDFTFHSTPVYQCWGNTPKPPLSIADYQEGAASTAIYPQSAAITYPALGLASEAGEVAGKIKKIIRDKGGVFDDEAKKAIADELGDVLWYVSALARDLGYKLEDLAQNNLDKLASRKARNVLGGSGDTR